MDDWTKSPGRLSGSVFNVQNLPTRKAETPLQWSIPLSQRPFLYSHGERSSKGQEIFRAEIPRPQPRV